MSRITDYVIGLQEALAETNRYKGLREKNKVTTVYFNYAVFVNGNELVKHLQFHEAQTLADECTGFGIADVCINKVAV
jgi:hypothetical protein